MSDLSVAVDRHDIVVLKPSSGLSVTYHREGRVLVADDPMRTDPTPEELIFLVRAGRLPSPRHSRSVGCTEGVPALPEPPAVVFSSEDNP
jgi:hypothetical protein